MSLVRLHLANEVFRHWCVKHEGRSVELVPSAKAVPKRLLKDAVIQKAPEGLRPTSPINSFAKNQCSTH